MRTLFDQLDECNGSIARRFAAFDAAHPEVYRLFCRFARELRAAGHERGSAQQIIERIRWESSVSPGHDGGFKVNNWFRTSYARKLLSEDPSFTGFFEFRMSGRDAA